MLSSHQLDHGANPHYANDDESDDVEDIQPLVLRNGLHTVIFGGVDGNAGRADATQDDECGSQPQQQNGI